MTPLKKQITLFIIALIYTHTHCMELALPQHLQYLTHTAIDTNQFKQLNFDDYTDAMIYYAQTKNKIMLKSLAKYANEENRQSTKDIERSSGWDSEDPFSSSALMEAYNTRLPEFTEPNSLKCHYAAKKHLVGAIRFFLKLNAHQNIRDTDGRTPLHRIVRNKDKIPFIAFRTEKDAENYEQKNNNAVELLIKHPKSNIIAQDSEGNTAIHYAANFKLIDHFLAIENVDLNIKNNQGETPLFYSLHHRGIRIEKGWKHDTITYNDYQFERLCDDLRTDVNTQNNSGETPLHYLINNTRITEIEHHSSNDMYYYPTLSYDNKQTQQLLKRADIDPNKQDNNKETPLHCAVKINSKTRVYNGERQSLEDHYKKSILELGDQIYLDNIQLLLTHPDTIINPTNKDGETPLICAVKASNISAIEKLLLYTHDNLPNHKKIDINIKDNNGSTALDHAEAKKNKEIINLLEKHGATHGSPSYTTTANNEDVNNQSAKSKATPASFFYTHKKAIQLCSLVGLMGMLASIMAYLHYR